MKNSLLLGSILILLISGCTKAPPTKAQITLPPSGSPNKRPVVNAGDDQMHNPNITTVSLQGTATDPDGSISSILWKKISGPLPGMIVNPQNLLSPVTGLTIGEYEYELEAWDNKGLSSKDSVKVTIYQWQAPVINNLIWNDTARCAINIDNINQYLSGLSINKVYIRSVRQGVTSAWVELPPLGHSTISDLMAYELTGFRLVIHSLRIDCNFDDTDSYSVKITF